LNKIKIITNCIYRPCSKRF